MLTSEFKLPAKPDSVSKARHATQTTLHESSLALSEDEVDTVLLLVSELATNAVLHASGVEFEVSLRACPRVLRVAVTDRSADEPRLRAALETDQHGRGLALVQGLATRCGWEHLHNGKRVWFELEMKNGEQQIAPTALRQENRRAGSGREREHHPAAGRRHASREPGAALADTGGMTSIP